MNFVRELNSDSSVGEVAPCLEETANSISSPVRDVPSPCTSLRVLLLPEVGYCLWDGA